MNRKRTFLFRALAVLVLVLIAGLMFIIGRGHTVYFDNKPVEYNGQHYECPYKIVVYVDGEDVAKLYEKERGMCPWMGQNFKMTLNITQEKGGAETAAAVGMKLPYSMDGIVINIPALLAGLPEEAYLSEFVPVMSEPEPEEVEIVTEELDLLGIGAE